MVEMVSVKKSKLKRILMKVAFFGSYMSSMLGGDEQAQSDLRDYYWNKMQAKAGKTQTFHEYAQAKVRAKASA